MAKRAKSGSKGSESRLMKVMGWLSSPWTRRFMLWTVYASGTTALAWGVTRGTDQLKVSIENQLIERIIPHLTLLDLPSELSATARQDLQSRVEPLLDTPWIADDLPRHLAESLQASGWVARVNFVERTGSGHFRVSCRYRVPIALVQQGTAYYLVDEAGFRLPGIYRAASRWPVIQGVVTAAPEAGVHWLGDDLQAGLALAAILAAEPFVEQITAISVENFIGRVHRRRSHIELLTDQTNGRIRWGSAPGRELEENTVAQKLTILRENYRQTGRIDAHYPVIDVSTFPNQFGIPG